MNSHRHLRTSNYKYIYIIRVHIGTFCNCRLLHTCMYSYVCLFTCVSVSVMYIRLIVAWLDICLITTYSSNTYTQSHSTVCLVGNGCARTFIWLSPAGIARTLALNCTNLLLAFLVGNNNILSLPKEFVNSHFQNGVN